MVRDLLTTYSILGLGALTPLQSSQTGLDGDWMIIQSLSSPAGAAEISCIQSSSSPWRYWMGTGWVLDGYWMGTGCAFEGYWMGTRWVLDEDWMSPSSPHPVPLEYFSTIDVI